MNNSITKLKTKQKLFCKEYIKDWNKERAVNDAGYKTKNPEIQACRLLKNVYVNEYIEELLNNAESKISEKWAISELLDNYTSEKRAGNGQLVAKYQELILKYKQLLTDKQVIETADVADFLKNEINKAASKPAKSNEIEKSVETVKNDNN